MRFPVYIAILFLGFLTACNLGGKKPGGGTTATNGLPWQNGGTGAQTTQPTPAVNHGKVATVNRELRFAVLDFALSRLPAPDQRLGVYRNGARVGEVTTTRMVDDTFLVADINKGDIRQGDDVRPE